ncbi:DUF418 domain-containing protein [Lentiprolixibacter aurantiacus]|uniref:DUF418 domain-containing protein n=1 Tax=Lentiprolixibacter aurantiacus TaxID=2993939 RepID=A0AAE3MMC1_9FLAO|nr:DUF418 domain-containing protein [Lentiprolixibacter aurantiacus]MCX2720094.1 DUF418 domain-containing protein [Lentiprolixibacter aurantiacus]
MKLQPISQGARIEAVDALRGFALFGVLLANVPYAGPETISGQWDTVLTFLSNFLISKKFITAFSILFGFGFYIQMTRAEEKGVNFRNYFLIRMGLLFLIGLIHSYGIWNGDIIMSYALGGVFLLLVRNCSLKKLILLAILFNVILTGIFFIGNSALGWQIYDYDYALDKEYPITLSFARYWVINFIMNPWTNFLKDLPITLVFTFGNMLIGVILGKLDFFRLSEKARRLSTYFIILGGTIGIASSYLFHKITIGDIELDLPLLWVPFVLAGGMILHSLLYVSVFVRAYQHSKFKSVLVFFKSVGRTALSNYILQSVFYLTLFYHCTHLLQLFGKITMGQTFLVALLLFVIQTGLSYLWLKKHSQGPLEYIWKKVSYGMAKLRK